MNSNTLLITGADGFTGQHLASAAVKQGFIVHGLSADITDNYAVHTEIQAIQPTHVIHLAAISSVTHADELEIYRVNLFGSMALLQALSNLSYPLEKILLASSANIYGNASISPIAETTCPAPINHYAMSKMAMEYMALNYLNKLPILFTRPFNYTGIGHDERFVIPKIIRHFIQKASKIELGNLHIEREFNDVRTVCDAYLKLLRYGKTGESYNICSGRTFSLRNVLDTLETLSEYSPSIIVNPAFVRSNEIHRLCGSPNKLEACIGELRHPSLKETLSWMLTETK